MREMIAEFRAAPAGIEELIAALGPGTAPLAAALPRHRLAVAVRARRLLARIAETGRRTSARTLRPVSRLSTAQIDVAAPRPALRAAETARPGPWRSRRSVPRAAWSACATTSVIRSARRCGCSRTASRSVRAHALHHDIAGEGGGRYSHWAGNVLMFRRRTTPTRTPTDAATASSGSWRIDGRGSPPALPRHQPRAHSVAEIASSSGRARCARPHSRRRGRRRCA